MLKNQQARKEHPSLQYVYLSHVGTTHTLGAPLETTRVVFLSILKDWTLIFLKVGIFGAHDRHTTLFMVFSGMYATCGGLH